MLEDVPPGRLSLRKESPGADTVGGGSIGEDGGKEKLGMPHYCQTCEAYREGGKIQSGKCIYCGLLIAPAIESTKLAPIDLVKLREIRHWEAVARVQVWHEGARKSANKQLLNGLGECVYFISDKPGHLVKIGFTNQLGERFFRISQENPGCTLLDTMPGTRQDEQAIHKMFYQFRQKNNSYTNHTEWFYLASPIRFFINHFGQSKPAQ